LCNLCWFIKNFPCWFLKISIILPQPFSSRCICVNSVFPNFRSNYFRHIDFSWNKAVRRADPSRCGAQCKTWVRGLSEQCFCDVIVFRQPCYHLGRAQICSAVLTRELSTFADVRYRGNLLVVTRAFFVDSEIYLALRLEFSSARCIWQKWTICPNTMARGPMQRHRLKAGPGGACWQYGTHKWYVIRKSLGTTVLLKLKISWHSRWKLVLSVAAFFRHFFGQSYRNLHQFCCFRWGTSICPNWPMVTWGVTKFLHKNCVGTKIV